MMQALPSLLAAAVAVAFAAMLGVQYARRRRPHQVLWAAAMLMFAVASFTVSRGLASGWSPGQFKTYWLFGAVLTVPYLAQGEIHLLVRNRAVTTALLFLLLFATAFALTRIRTAHIAELALRAELPSGADAFTKDPFALHLARYTSIPAYVVLVGGAGWSALRMRGRRELRSRFLGTAAIAAGATVVAGGSAFAATGNALGFSLTLLTGIATMFYGFLKAPQRPVAE